MNLHQLHLNRNTSSQDYFNLKLKRSSKGKARQATLFSNFLPLNFKHKKLTFMVKSSGGRNSSGQKTLRTRGSIVKKTNKITVNFFYRQRNINFIAGFFLTPLYNKLLSLLFLSSGCVSYVTTTSQHILFTLQKLYPSTVDISKKFMSMNRVHSLIWIQQGFYLISQLPKNKPVSWLELLPGKGVQYIRSTGTSGFILKMDSRLGKSIIKLPSGVKKFFSVYSIGAKGSIALPLHKNFQNKKAGYYTNFGFKPTVRGVAMNPVDHPHGGRAKSIKYQRTP